jgi:hypothetical protein
LLVSGVQPDLLCSRASSKSRMIFIKGSNTNPKKIQRIYHTDKNQIPDESLLVPQSYNVGMYLWIFREDDFAGLGHNDKGSRRPCQPVDDCIAVRINRCHLLKGGHLLTSCSNAYFLEARVQFSAGTCQSWDLWFRMKMTWVKSLHTPSNN